MSRRLPVDISDLARDQVLAADNWWRAHRLSAPNAIREDLERAIALLAVQPHLGSLARNTSLAGVRRVHLSRIRYDVYYRVTTQPERVEILAFWHAQRDIGPPLSA